MKIVILAAGKGTRMGELTRAIPKPLLSYQGKTLLQHKLAIVSPTTSEIVIVIGYLGTQIKEAVGDSYDGIPITYVTQHETLGTAHALWQCRHYLDQPFTVLMADDLYAKADIDALEAGGDDWAVLAHRSGAQERGGKCLIRPDGYLDEIYEDFEGTHPCPLIYSGVCHLTPEIFERDMVVLSNGEYGLPQTLSAFSKKKDIRVVETKDWKRITAPEDLV